MKLSSRSAALACVTVAAVALTACGGSGHKKQTDTPTPPVTTATTPAPTPTPKPAAVSPFTGLAPSKHYVVAAKIDDTSNGRPQVGINGADIVYIEEVEGGLTRLLGVFNTNLPTVEAVRSTRAGDPEVLGQYGPIAYVASGGASNPLSVLDKSDLKSDINDRGGPGFQRDGNRSAPYNLRADLAQIAAAKKGAKAKSIGLSWSTTIPNRPEGKGTTVQTTVGGTAVQFNWNAKTKRYDRVIGGAVQHAANGKTIATSNVIVQFCSITVYTKDTDVMGNPNMYTHTIGKGKVAIFRNGERIDGTWSRAKLTSGTTYKDSHGKAIPLSKGNTWVALVATGTRLN